MPHRGRSLPVDKFFLSVPKDPKVGVCPGSALPIFPHVRGKIERGAKLPPSQNSSNVLSSKPHWVICGNVVNFV